MTDAASPSEKSTPPKAALPVSQRLLEMISVRLSVEFGAARIRLRDLLDVEEGGIIELDNDLDTPLAIYANNALLGRGEVVRCGTRFGIRITEISDAEQRLAYASPDAGAAS